MQSFPVALRSYEGHEHYVKSQDERVYSGTLVIAGGGTFQPYFILLDIISS